MGIEVKVILVILFLMMVGLAYVVGRMDGGIREMEKQRKAWMEVKPVQEKPPDPETEAERLQREKAAAMRKGFMELMSYDVQKATKG